MIRDLSETLKAVLKDPGFATEFPELKNSEVIFDRPFDAFNPGSSTINMFLYDIRENLELRSNELQVEYRNGEAISHPAALRLNCSYLVTAWPKDGVELALQEHRLLSQVLRVLSRYPTIPPIFLKGSLAGQQPPCPMVALHPDALKNLTEFWSSLGAKMRASLTLTATISVPVFEDITDFVVTTHTTNFGSNAPAPPTSWVQIGGKVLGAGAQGIAGALVDILDAGLHATTDSDGQFNFMRVPPGTHTVRAVAVGFKPQTQNVTVPGKTEDYVITLTSL